MRALRILERINSSPELLRQDDRGLLEELAATHRTAWDTFLIMYAASLVRWETPFTPERLEYLLAGDDLNRGRDTRPWDVQFELFTAAWLILGGVEVTPGEPDLRLLYGREQVGIAAKRVSSLQPKQLKDRVKSAVGQIQASGRPGFISLNLDSRFADLDPVQDRSRLIPEFDRRFNELHDHARHYAREPLVIGIMSFGYAAAWSEHPGSAGVPQLYRTAPFRWQAFDDAPGGKALFDAFAEGWEGRISTRFERMMAGEFD